MKFIGFMSRLVIKLIDAMAWFGVKGPLRQSIIEDDKWFPTAELMVDHLTMHFTLDDQKEFYLINQEDTASERSKHREEHQIKGCSAARIITFFPDGSVNLQNSSRYKLVNGELEVL